MEKSFDLGALLQNHEKKHKTRPTQFVSVAGGVRKRLESNIRCRKSHRLTYFDSIRNLPSYDSPKKQPDPLTKEEHRRMQLEKWKEEKDKKKKQAAAQKKKPFIAGVAHAPLKFVPPPPLPRAVPSTSGRVTRSQSAKTTSNKPKASKTTNKQEKTESFAPKNAAFKAPEFKSLMKVPTLVPVSKLKKTKETISFDPVLPAALKLNGKIKEKVNQEPKRPPRGKFVLTTTSSSSQSHSSEDKPPPVSPTSKRIPMKSDPSSLIANTSPASKQTKSKKKSSRKSIHSSESIATTVEKPAFKTRTPRKSIVYNKTSTPKNPIPKSESSSEERLRSPKSPVDVPLTPEQIVEEATKNSPFVTLSRGKANARRETLKKIDDGLFEEDASNVNSVDHFRRQLDSEIKRMTEMCETWEKISQQIVLPETVQELVLGAVGQARLLMSHKLQQFAALVARCERPEPGHALVTPADLHGFWDMVFMQVVNVDVRFKKLEEMRARNWAEEAPPARRRKPAPRAVPAPAAAPAPRDRPPAASRLRDMIAAARKAKKQDVQSEVAVTETQPAKTFEAGFFCVRSPVRSPARRPPSLLRAVLSSETKKSANKNTTSLAMLRASLIGKNVDGDGDSPAGQPLVPLTPINLQATPGRGILKPLNTPSAKKSLKVVLFDDSDVEAHEATTTKRSEPTEDTNELKKVPTDVHGEGEQKENKPKRKSLMRQDAVADSSPVMTRSRRKSLNAPSLPAAEDEKTPKRSSRRKKTLQEAADNVAEEKSYTSKRSSRRRSVLQGDVA